MKIKRSETVAEFFDTIVVAELKSYLKIMKAYCNEPPAGGCWFADEKRDRKRIKKTIKALKTVLAEYE